MTEAEWLACTDPETMLQFLRTGIVTVIDEPNPPFDRAGLRLYLGAVVRRKLPLFACACCRFVWATLEDARSRRDVEVTEQFVDGLTSAQELSEAKSAALEARNAVRPRARDRDRTDGHVLRVAANAAWQAAALEAAEAARESAAVAAWTNSSLTLEDARRCQAALLRDVIGNPFRPLLPRPSPAHVVGLARSCYEAFPAVSDQFLILADALEELGESGAADHCRQVVHVKGCHVLDWILVRG